MKLKITSLFLCASMIAFYACSNENEEGQEIGNSSLRITTDIATRSVIESSTFTSGDQIGIFLSDGNQKNVRGTYDTKWILEKNISLTETPVLVYAYYPYIDDRRGEMAKVDITPNAVVTGQADYLYGTSAKEVSATYPDAFIYFNHALARITLSIKRSADDAGYGMLSKVRLQNAGSNKTIATSGWMDVTTGEISNKIIGTILLDMNHTLNKETTQNVDILVIPTVMEKEGMAELALTIDGSQYIVKMPAATWEAGQQYTYPITINRADAHIVVTPAKVGDYYYSDGSWSTEYDANRTCIGIVFALSEEKDGDINVSLSESMHGRIVALEDVGEYAWGPNTDVEGIPNYIHTAQEDGDNYMDEYLPIDGISEYDSKSSPDFRLPYNYSKWPTKKSMNYALTDYAGKEHSGYLQTEEFPAGNACYSYTTVGTNKGFWYLPSCGEMGRLAMACAIKVIDTSKQTVFDNIIGRFWTSTEGYNDYRNYYFSWYYNTLNGLLQGTYWEGQAYTRNTQFNVRPISSF